jgi:hypothetical protein
MVGAIVPPVESSEERSFTLFPKLPVELQLKIWKAALQTPRTIKIEYYEPWASDQPSPPNTHSVTLSQIPTSSSYMLTFEKRGHCCLLSELPVRTSCARLLQPEKGYTLLPNNTGLGIIFSSFALLRTNH